jgi:hypothetical protein
MHGVRAFEEDCRHFWQRGTSDRSLHTRIQPLAARVLPVFERQVQAVQESNHRDEHASLVIYLD